MNALLMCTATLLSLLSIHAAAQCELSFTVNPQLSNFSLGGGVVQPLVAPLVPSHGEALIGLEGRLLAQLAGRGPCPGTVEELVGQLAGSSFGTTTELGPLFVYPASIQATVGSLATVECLDVAFNATVLLASSPAPAAAGASLPVPPPLVSTVAASVSQGYALMASLLTPAPEDIDLVGLSASNTTQALASVQGGLARVELHGLQLTFSRAFTSPLDGVLDFVLQGSLVLEAAVGCPADCGPHGRCWPATGGVAGNTTEGVGCSCECGWAGAACDVPSGFCPRFAAEAGTEVCPVLTPPPSPQPSPAPAAACPPCSKAQECNPRQQLNAATGRCECLPGWTGPQCDSCETSDACSDFYGTKRAVCSAGDYRFVQNSQYKAYLCGLKGTYLEPFFMKQSNFTVNCNTSQPSVPGDPSGRSCQMTFTFADSSLAVCTMYECSFRVNSTRVDCATMRCECEKPCPDFQVLINMANNKPVVLDCDPATGMCPTDIQDFLAVITAPCTVSECLVEGYSLEEGAYTVTEENAWYNAVIAAVPLMCLLAVSCSLGLCLLAHRPHLSASTTPPPPPPPGGDLKVLALEAAGLQAGTAAVQELRFEQLSCSVPIQRGWRLGASATAALECRLWCGPKRGKGVACATAAQSRNDKAQAISHGPGMKDLLLGVSGVARRGELVGVLGPSGSGKTTLLALLTGSSEHISRGAHVEGAVLLDGIVMRREERKQVAFVPQDDSPLETLTVAECLAYSALLRLPPTLSPKQSRVWRVIDELGLGQVAVSRVGGGMAAGRGISGGERRRVTLGMELVTDPQILILDESTSGLDSHTALHLMRTLKEVASAGRIVMLSFHQPSPAMFNLLDRAYLLAGGACVFCGPPAAAEAHFAAAGLPCPVGSAVAEHMLEVASDPLLLGQLLASTQASTAGGKQVAATTGGAAAWQHGPTMYAASLPGSPVSSAEPAVDEDQLEGGELPAASECGRAQALPAAVAAPGARGCALGSHLAGISQGGALAAAARADASGGCRVVARRLHRELGIIFWRTLVDILRNPSLMLLHWALALAMGLLMGVVFFGVGESDMASVQNRGGGIYFSLAVFAFTSLTTTDLLTAERRLVAREVRGGYYSPWTYLLCKAALDGLLLRVIPVMLYSAPFYPMMGLQSGPVHVALFLMVLATFAVAVEALSLAVTVGCSTPGKASLVMTVILLVSLLVGGFLVNVNSIPAWVRWLHYLSLFYYAYVSLTTNEAANLSFSLEVEGYTALKDVNGLAVLETFGIDASKLTTWVIVLDCLYAACLLLAFALLYLRLPRAKQLSGRRRVGTVATKKGVATHG